jgi:hypothetical protein
MDYSYFFDEYSLGKSGPNSKIHLHLINVYKDPDFDKDLADLFPDVLGPDTDDTSIVIKKSSYPRFIDCMAHVYWDEKAILVEEVPREQMIALADKYVITESNVLSYLLGNPHTNTNTSKNVFDIKKTDNRMTVSFNLDVTKQDILMLWSDIALIKELTYGKVPKNKLPQNGRLIYAIWKQRQKSPPLSFGKIYKLYIDKKLPNYSEYEDSDYKSTMTLNDLTREYNRYKPR